MTFPRLLKRTLCVLILTFATGAVHAAPGDFIDIFASEPALARPDGMVVGPDGLLYVSSQQGQSILRFNATTGVFVDLFAGNDLPLEV